MKLEQTHTQLEIFALSGTSPPNSNAVEKTCDRILAYLKLQDAPSDKAKILSSVRGRRQYKIAALRLLLQENKVARFGAGKKCDAYLYFVEKIVQSNHGEIVEEITI